MVSVVLLSAGCEKPEQGVSSASIQPTVPAMGDPPLPGIESVDRALQRHLARALSAKGPEYIARTKHLQEDGTPRFTNRLIEESSPYLLQHAHNPVNWYPWSDEAFERAKRENKPIFLSIGYSTCHWCHVMERESFEDEDIAAFLNRHFIAIKVDREERPDVDSVYMTAVNILAGRGGWPMTLLMTPDRQPFFGGTYFPPRKGVRGARIGLIDILTEMVAFYRNDRAQVVARARDISQRVERATNVRSGPGVPSDQTIAAAVSDLATRFDRMNGGFTGAPKFPQPAQLLLLLRYAHRTKDPGATAMVTTTLDRMASGGIHDHVGGGFHRYSTDARWLVPHFEKMLYDNAQLAIAYLEAWQHTGDSDYPPIVRTILAYVLRDMTSETGAFYSATDADSRAPDGEDREGWFFTWTTDELEDVLGKEKAAVLAAAFGVTDQGNFEGRNILHREQTDGQVASELGMAPTKATETIHDALRELLEARSSRPLPIRDDKIIAAWNGMMISAFARAGWSLGDATYVKAAARAAKFVLSTMRDDRGRLVRTYRDGTKATTSFLDDYAFMVSACLDLYETTGYFPWLVAALDLQREQDARFADTRGGGYFLTANDAETPLVRQKPAYDDSIPSGNSISAQNLLRLYDLTGRDHWRQAAERLFAFLGLRVTRSPTAFPFLLVALDRYYDVPREIAIIVSESRREGLPFAERLRTAFVPNKVFTILREREAARQATRIPWLDAKRVTDGKPTAYVCERGRCELPTTRPSVFARQIDKRIPYPSFLDESPPQLQFEGAR